MYLEGMAVYEATRASRQRVKDLLVEQYSGKRHESGTESLADGLDIRAANALLLPCMHGACLTHAANDLSI